MRLEKPKNNSLSVKMLKKSDSTPIAINFLTPFQFCFRALNYNNNHWNGFIYGVWRRIESISVLGQNVNKHINNLR